MQHKDTNQKELTEILRRDGSGVELRRLQRELRSSRDVLMGQRDVMNLEMAAKAYDAGIALLPELWRLEQRK